MLLQVFAVLASITRVVGTVNQVRGGKNGKQHHDKGGRRNTVVDGQDEFHGQALKRRLSWLETRATFVTDAGSERGRLGN